LTGECIIQWQLEREAVSIVDRLLASIRQQPGIAAAGIISNLPLSGDNSKTAVTPKGYVPQAGESVRAHYSYGVNGDYFPALGIPLREGRFLTAEDSQRATRVCVVDEDFARRYWPGGGALGQRVAHGDETDDAKLFTIVGVVGAVKQADLTEGNGQGAIYLPFIYRNNGAGSIFIVTRTSQNPEAFADTLRKLVRGIHPELAFDNVRSMDARVAESLVARRSPALVAGMFAGVALLLAAIGTYGVLSYAVAQRRREIGIRMALGAQREQIARQFLLVGVRLLALGTLVGLVGAVLAGRAMQSILFDVPPLHLASFLATAAVMALVSLGACLLPARRAASVDPIVALHAD
jgi:predicted permease